MAVSTIDALYNGTSEKLTTSATGITVTGTVAATAYTGDGSALTGVGSPSIDDNGNATAITIDSSENVMVGKAVTNLGTAGITLGESGFGSFTRSGYEALNVNRLSSDGSIAKFYKDGTEVGSIGSYNSNALYVMAPANGGCGLLFSNNAAPIYPIQNVSGTATLSDGHSDLGAAVHRFKDAYLSGGIYLGGAVAANKLSDYEEGTWSPSSVGVSIGVNGNKAKYTKIGNTVIASAELNVASNSNNAQLRVTLPFTVGLVSDGGFIRYSNAGSNAPAYVVSNDNNADVVFYNLAGGAATFADVSNKRVDFLIIYRV